MPAGGSRSGVQTGTEREHDYKPYRVVRVDTSKPADNNDDEASHQEDAGQDSDEELEISPLELILSLEARRMLAKELHAK